MTRSQAGDLGVVALVGALVLVQRGLPAESDRFLVAGIALLCFWVWTALRAGTALADALEPDPGRRLVRQVLLSILFAVGSVLLAALLHRIDATTLTIWNAIVFLGAPRLPRAPGSLPSPPTLRSMVRDHPLAGTWGIAIGVLVALNVAWGLLTPIHHRDDLTYHLVFPIEWFQSGTLTNRLIPFGNHSPAYFPKNAELLFTWIFLPLRRFVHLPLLQLFFVAGTAVVGFRLLRRCGASARSASMATLLYGACPAMLRYLDGGYVDIAFAFLFLAALEFLVAFLDRPGVVRWLELCAVAGLFLGVKSFAALHTAVVLVPVGVALGLRRLSRARRCPAPRLAACLLGGLLLALASGGWWYARNLLQTGNPLFPLHVTFLGRTWFEGLYTRDAFRPTRLPTLLELLPRPLWILLTIGALWTLIRAVIPRSRSALRPGSLVGLGILLPLALALLSWKVLPGNYARHALALVPLASASLVAPLESARWIRGLFGLALLGCLVAVLADPIMGPTLVLPLGSGPSHFNGGVRVAFAAVSSGLLAGAFVLTRSWPAPVRAALATAASIGVLLVGAHVSDPFGEHVKPRRWAPYRFIHEGYGDARIAVTGTNETLRAFGPVAAATVRYVNVNDTGDALFHEHFLASGAGGEADHLDLGGAIHYRRRPGFEAWKQNLARFGAELLVVSQLPSWTLGQPYVRDGGFPIEGRWAEEHPDLFRRVLASPRLRVYEIQR